MSADLQPAVDISEVLAESPPAEFYERLYTFAQRVADIQAATIERLVADRDGLRFECERWKALCLELRPQHPAPGAER